MIPGLSDIPAALFAKLLSAGMDALKLYLERKDISDKARQEVTIEAFKMVNKGEEIRRLLERHPLGGELQSEPGAPTAPAPGSGPEVDRDA